MAKKEFIWDVETSALEHANKPKEAKTQKCPHLFLIWHGHRLFGISGFYASRTLVLNIVEYKTQSLLNWKSTRVKVQVDVRILE